MFKKIINSATWKQSQITIFGALFNGVLGALFYVLMARFLGPASFGLFSIFVATLTLIADIVDFGINTGLVRFVSANWKNDRILALKFLKLGLESKLIIWAFVFLIGFFSAPFVAEKIFNKPDLAGGLRLTLVGVGGALVFSFATASLQALQKYFAWSFVNIFTNFLRLIILAVLIFYQQLNLQSGLITYIALPFFGFFLTLLILPTQKLLKTKGEFSISRQFFGYNSWVATFAIIAAVSSRLDIFLNARLLSNVEVGIYSAASQLTSVLPQLVGALGVVAAPKFSQYQNINQMLTYFKKFQMMVLGLSVLISMVIPAAFYFVPLIYGSEYQTAIWPFIILLIAMIIFLISVPLHNSIIYYFGKPQVFVWVALGHLLIVAILGYFLISSYGVVGAATTVAIGMIFNFFAPLLWFFQRIRKQ